MKIARPSYTVSAHGLAGDVTGVIMEIEPATLRLSHPRAWTFAQATLDWLVLTEDEPMGPDFHVALQRALAGAARRLLDAARLYTRYDASVRNHAGPVRCSADYLGRVVLLCRHAPSGDLGALQITFYQDKRGPASQP